MSNLLLLKTTQLNISDEELVQLCQQEAQREKGFRLLVERYQERLYWHIRRLVIEHEDANDVLQNCLLKAYKSIGKFKKKSKLYTWLYRIATNESLTFLKKKKRKSTHSLDDVDMNLANQLRTDPYFDGDELEIKLQVAINQLPEKQQLVFNMRYFDEMTYREISQVLGTSTGSLKASYHHAAKKIEAYLT